MPLLIIDRFPNTLLSSPRIDIKSTDTRFTVVGVYVCKFPALLFLCGTIWSTKRCLKLIVPVVKYVSATQNLNLC